MTLYEVALAMMIACGGGILAGALVGGSTLLRNLLLPVFSSLYAVPIVILYPVFTAWFGVGSESKIAFAGIYAFFPVMLSTAAGIRTIDPQFILAARSMGATLPQQITRVIIPASVPTVFTGLRLGGALTIIGVVVSEMLTSAAGIGYLVTLNRTILDSPRVFAAILMILVLAVAYYMLARAIERRMVVWQIRRTPAGGCHRARTRQPCRRRRRRDHEREQQPCQRGSCRPRSWAAIRSPTGWSNREMLSKVVPRTRMKEIWRVAEPFLEQAQDDATLSPSATWSAPASTSSPTARCVARATPTGSPPRSTASTSTVPGRC